MKLSYTTDDIDTPTPKFVRKSKDTTEVLHVRGLRLAKNPNFVYADLAGHRISVLAGRKHASRLQGKPFTVRADNTGTETTYHYLP